MTSDDITDLEALAAEYVLGTLDSDDRQNVRRRLQSDESFAQMVTMWEGYLAPIAKTVEPVEPPLELFLRIMDEIKPPVAKKAIIPGILDSVTPMLDRIAFWRWATLGSSSFAAAAASLALYFGLSTPEPVPDLSQRYVAVLDAGTDAPALVVNIDVVTNQMTIRPVGAASAPGSDQALELWVVADETPRSLGLLDPNAQTAFDLQNDLSGPVFGGGVLAVSIEPSGGSPTGLPTGEVIYHGQVVSLDE